MIIGRAFWGMPILASNNKYPERKVIKRLRRKESTIDVTIDIDFFRSKSLSKKYPGKKEDRRKEKMNLNQFIKGILIQSSIEPENDGISKTPKIDTNVKKYATVSIEEEDMVN